MSKVKTISILALVLLIPAGFLMFQRPAKVTVPKSPWNSTMRLSDPEMDVSKLTVYETLPDYDYSGPTLRLIFLDAERKTIRNFKSHLTLLDQGKGGGRDFSAATTSIRAGWRWWNPRPTTGPFLREERIP